MSDELVNEVEVINSIYGPQTLQQVSAGSNIYTLSLSQHAVTLRLSFPQGYPDATPQILGTENTGESVKKGYGKFVLDEARGILRNVCSTGLVCIYDLMQELEVALSVKQQTEDEQSSTGTQKEQLSIGPLPPTVSTFEIPNWTLSAPATEKKSIFLARACCVTSPEQVQSFISHLLSHDKRVSKATHNISAYRILCLSSSAEHELAFQDCDDDGENAAGGRLLHMLQVMDVWGVLVVVSRWYGGVRLGPDRFRIINSVAREAVMAGGWVKGGGNKKGS